MNLWDAMDFVKGHAPKLVLPIVGADAKEPVIAGVKQGVTIPAKLDAPIPAMVVVKPLAVS